MEELVATPLALEGAAIDSVVVSVEIVADSFPGSGTGVADFLFFPAFVFLGEWADFLNPFSAAGSTGASLLLPFPCLEGMMRRSSTILTNSLQLSGRCVVYAIQPSLISSHSVNPSF